MQEICFPLIITINFFVYSKPGKYKKFDFGKPSNFPLFKNMCQVTPIFAFCKILARKKMLLCHNIFC